MSRLQVEGLHFSYGKNAVLRDVQFDVAPGCFTAIMGENGSGKSTLLKSINRVLKLKAGTVLIDGSSVVEMSGREIARRMGYVPQRQEAAKCTVFEAVLLGRKTLGLRETSQTDLARTEEVLQKVHLDHLAMRHTTELSGGELQKVMLARALAQDPKVLLLDEPTNHLDPVNQVEVMDLLHRITRELDLATLVVSHDLNASLRFADQFILLKGGAIYRCGGRQIITPEAIRSVFKIEAVLEEVSGIPVVVPLSASR